MDNTNAPTSHARGGGGMSMNRGFGGGRGGLGGSGGGGGGMRFRGGGLGKLGWGKEDIL